MEGVGQARALSSNSYARQRRGGDRGGKVRSGHGAAATDAAYTSTNAAPTAAQTAAVASIKAAAASTATATATVATVAASAASVINIDADAATAAADDAIVRGSAVTYATAISPSAAVAASSADVIVTAAAATAAAAAAANQAARANAWAPVAHARPRGYPTNRRRSAVAAGKRLHRSAVAGGQHHRPTGRGSRKEPMRTAGAANTSKCRHCRSRRHWGRREVLGKGGHGTACATQQRAPNIESDGKDVRQDR